MEVFSSENGVDVKSLRFSPIGAWEIYVRLI